MLSYSIYYEITSNSFKLEWTNFFTGGLQWIFKCDIEGAGAATDDLVFWFSRKTIYHRMCDRPVALLPIGNEQKHRDHNEAHFQHFTQLVSD